MAGALSQADVARWNRTGVGVLTDDHALELFDRALRTDLPLAFAVRLESKALRAQAQAGLLPPMLRGVVRTPARRAQTANSLLGRLSQSDASGRHAILSDLVRRETAAILGHTSADAIDPERPFTDLGADSLTALELRNRISIVTGLRLSTTLIYDHPTPHALAGLLESRLNGADGRPRVGEDPSDAHVRAILASIPPARLRAAGLIEPLLSIAASEPYGTHATPAVALDGLGAEELVRLALEPNGAPETQPAGSR